MIYRHYVIWEDSGYTVLGRILGHDGSAVSQSDVDSITYTIAERSTPGTPVATGTIEVTNSVYTELQTSDSRWTRDTTGFNFAAAMPATTVPDGNKVYQLDFSFTPSTGEVYHFPVTIPTRNLFGS